MDTDCLVSHIDQLLVKMRDMAFGALETSGHIRIADDLIDCVVRSDSRIFNCSLLCLLDPSGCILFNLKCYKHEYYINCYLRVYESLIKDLSVTLPCNN